MIYWWLLTLLLVSIHIMSHSLRFLVLIRLYKSEARWAKLYLFERCDTLVEIIDWPAPPDHHHHISSFPGSELREHDPSGPDQFSWQSYNKHCRRWHPRCWRRQTKVQRLGFKIDFNVILTSSDSNKLIPNSGRIRAPRTRIRRPRMTPFCTEVALKVNVETPALLIE